MLKILSFGEILFDINGNSACLGGAPLNFCAHAVHAGAQAAMLSAVGRDAYGQEALAAMRAYGIGTEYVAVLPDKPTGRCLVTLSDGGIPTYDLVQGVAYDFIPLQQLPQDCDVLYFGTLALRSGHNLETMKALLARRIAREVFVDMNIRGSFYSDETILLGLRNATIVKISDEELPVIARTLLKTDAFTPEQVAEKLTAEFTNIRLLLLTCGGEGSVAYDLKTGERFSCGAVKTQVVSTVGAGDSFSATFLVNYLQGADIPRALEKAARVSAFVVSREGAIPPDMPQM